MGEWHKRNKERLRAYSRLYYQKHKAHKLAFQKEYHRKNRDVLNAKRRAYDRNNKQHIQARTRKWAYGLTQDVYESILTAQEGVCAICKHPDSKRNGQSLFVDHNHKTGKVRGLLCMPCNMKISVLEDKQFVSLAKTYLQRKG